MSWIAPAMAGLNSTTNTLLVELGMVFCNDVALTMGKVRRDQVTPPFVVRYNPVLGLAANAVRSVAKAGEKAIESTPTPARLERVQMFPPSVEMNKPGAPGPLS